MGIKLLYSTNNQVPFCEHGPALHLEFKNGSSCNKVYVCAASRSNRCKLLAKNQNKINFKAKRKEMIKRMGKFIRLKKCKRKFCTTCQLLLLPCEWENHFNHNLIENLHKSSLRKPTKLLTAKTINSKEAQFLFDESTVLFLISTLSKLGYTRVINVGCPSVHEKIQSSKKSLNMNSLLLDIDSRYCQFYTRRNFLLFNMFNGYFFEEVGKFQFETFLQKSKPSQLCLLIDPPFGGLIEAIAKTIEFFNQKCKSIFDSNFVLPIFFFFPYFNQKQIDKYLSSLKMLDYKVNYINHLKFSKFKSKFGSIVRIFTNIEPSLIELPLQDGYHFCDICKRYVSSLNRHCFKCNSCTSKDGKSSVHCDICNKCFKETWKHCQKCGICCLPLTCKCTQNKNPKKKKSNYKK